MDRGEGADSRHGGRAERRRQMRRVDRGRKWRDDLRFEPAANALLAVLIRQKEMVGETRGMVTRPADCVQALT